MLVSGLLLALAAPLALAGNLTEADLGNCKAQCETAYKYGASNCDMTSKASLTDKTCLAFCSNVNAAADNCLICYSDSTKNVTKDIQMQLSDAVVGLKDFCAATSTNSSGNASSTASAKPSATSSAAKGTVIAIGSVVAALGVSVSLLL